MKDDLTTIQTEWEKAQTNLDVSEKGQQEK